MYRFKTVAVLLSLAVFAVFLLSIAAAPAVEAGGGKIKTEFEMKDNTAFTPDIAPLGTVEGHGSGKFELASEDLDNLEFKLKFKADDLLPHTWYRASITIRDTYAAPSATNTADHMVVVGWTKTNGEGKLNFKGKAIMPDPTLVTPGATEWRIDQQITLPSLTPVVIGGCVDCILVCAPTTKVKLNADGDGLVLGP